MNSLNIFRNLRFILPVILVMTGIQTHIRAAYADMDVYVQRAEKAMEENSPAMAIGMYSQLLKEYSPNAPEEDQTKYAETFMKASDVCFDQSRFLESLEFATSGLKAAERADDNYMIMRLLGNIGKIHAVFDDHERAVAYYMRGHRISPDKNDPAYQYKFLLSLTMAYVRAGNVDKAKECFRKRTLVPIVNRDSETNFFNNYLQGMIAEAEGEILLARYHHKAALDIAACGKFPPHFTINQNWEMGKTYLVTGQPDSAKYYFDIALKEADINNQPGQTPKIYLSLSEVAKMYKDSVEYSRFKRLEQEATNTFFNTAQYNSKRNQLVEYEEMVKDSTIKELNDRVAMQWTFIGAGILIIITVGVFYFILMKKNKDLKFANNKLMDKNRELIRAEETNRRLMDKQLESVEATDLNPEESLTETTQAVVAEGSQETESPNDMTKKQDNESNEGEGKQAYLSDDQIEILLTRIRKALKEKTILFNPDFSLNMLAQTVKSNTKYVSWVINQTYGKNFKTLLNELRVQEASKMLDDFENYGNYTIQAISEDVGYKSSTSFILAFKRIIGMTPSAYQKLAKERLEATETTPAPDSPADAR